MEAWGRIKSMLVWKMRKSVEGNWLKFILVLTKFTHNINSKPNFLREIVLVYRHCFCSASFLCFISGQNVLPILILQLPFSIIDPLSFLVERERWRRRRRTLRSVVVERSGAEGTATWTREGKRREVWVEGKRGREEEGRWREGVNTEMWSY